MKEPGRDLPRRKGFSSSSVYLPQVLQRVAKHADWLLLGPQDVGLVSGLNSRKSQAFRVRRKLGSSTLCVQCLGFHAGDAP